MSGLQAKEEKMAADEHSVLDQERFVREGPQKRFIEPRLLYLIKKSPSYGYQLTEDIGNLPFPGPIPDSAAVYRMLRDLEKTGLVCSEWAHGESGPSRGSTRSHHRGRRGSTSGSKLCGRE